MCNFHEAVARKAAADPITGRIHPGHKAVIRVALSRFWAERYVAGGESVNGYNPYPLATREQQAAFRASGLQQPPETVRAREAAGIAYLRLTLAALEKTQDLSAAALRLPVPTAREAFMDMAIATIYEGEPKGVFNVAPRVERQDLQPLHRAVSALHGNPQTRQVLEMLVQGQICTLYSAAPSQVNRALLERFESLPERVRTVSARLTRYAGNIVLGGFSGLIGHGLHYGSILGAGMAAGTASSLNMALSGAFLMASYSGWHKFFGGQYRAGREQAGAFAVQAALTVAIAAGVPYLLPHDHMHGERAVWFASLPAEMRDEMLRTSQITYSRLPDDLRARLDEKAQEEGLTPAVYLLTCSGEEPVSRDITRFLTLNKTLPMVGSTAPSP